MRRSEFHFDLPAEQIAQYPADQRGDSRLLCVDPGSGRLTDRGFHEFPRLLEPGDVLVFNDTRVIPARLTGSKASGGKVEVLVERITGAQTVLAHVRASKSPAAGTCLYLEGGIRCCEIGGVMFGKLAENGSFVPPPLDLVRLALPRRVYTQSHVDRMLEICAGVGKRARGAGLRGDSRQ